MENLQELTYGDSQYYSSNYGVDIALLDNEYVFHIQCIEQVNEEMDLLLNAKNTIADKEERLCALARLIGVMRRNSDEHKIIE